MKFEVCDGVVYVGSEKSICGLGLYDRKRAEELAHTLTWRELRDRMAELKARGLDKSIEYETVEEAYWIADSEMEKAYFEENFPKLWAFYEEVKNQPTSEWWDFFSDWHKDVYGFRPTSLIPETLPYRL